ncbi:Exosome component 3 [Chytridiales sp. JEL 0842]|nr:Exosome component 3 [Chytridiales sp. JEL 0842]
MSSASTVVLPGDLIPTPTPQQDTTTIKLKIGPGLRQENDQIHACKAGVLLRGPESHSNKIWVEQSQKRYIPQSNESVVGIVRNRHAEGYRVDIGSAHPATLPALAFEGATKRNKPNFEVGTLVYARISLANKDMEPELDCINPATGKADGYGELKEGFMFTCSLGLCRSLLDPSNAMLGYLGKAIPFEIAVGMNGRVWIKANSPQEVVVVMNTIKGSEGLPPPKAKEYVKSCLKKLEDVTDD